MPYTGTPNVNGSRGRDLEQSNRHVLDGPGSTPSVSSTPSSSWTYRRVNHPKTTFNGAFYAMTHRCPRPSMRVLPLVTVHLRHWELPNDVLYMYYSATYCSTPSWAVGHIHCRRPFEHTRQRHWQRTRLVFKYIYFWSGWHNLLANFEHRLLIY
jgi:hypothetical protein